MKIHSTGETAYFAASNSYRGFHSYYQELFDAADISHVYAVKGGPGTGKSRFLRDVAEYAERRGWHCEYVYCSSDPLSLDGVILTSLEGCRMALLDATAPHVYEPSCPGAREELVNLGAFWDAVRLSERVEEIDRLNQEKKKAYRRAYRFLSGLGEMSADRDELVAPFVKRHRICALATRLMQEVAPGDRYQAMPALIRSVGMQGEVAFDTYYAEASKLYILEDCRGIAQYLMTELGALCVERRVKLRISHDPVEPHKIDGLFLLDSGVAFVVGDPNACTYPRKKIGMRRFLDTAAMREVRGAVSFSERMCRAMREGAMDALEAVREKHFRLEEIYASAMDFDAKEAFTKAFCQGLFDEKYT